MTIALNSGDRVDLKGSPNRYAVTSALNVANAISRDVKMFEDCLIPCVIMATVVSSIAAGVFLGTPFFVIVAFLGVGSRFLIQNQVLQKKEDLDSLKNFFDSRGAFKFEENPNIKTKVNVIHGNGYAQFMLQKIEEKQS